MIWFPSLVKPYQKPPILAFKFFFNSVRLKFQTDHLSSGSNSDFTIFVFTNLLQFPNLSPLLAGNSGIVMHITSPLYLYLNHIKLKEWFYGKKDENH